MRNSIFIAVIASLLASCAQQQASPGVSKADDRITCLQETGSRIKPAPGECNNQPGRVVTREEMERSGAFNTRDAIRRSIPQAN